jgi:tetratricopeptide (TPR) repeat protein
MNEGEVEVNLQRPEQARPLYDKAMAMITKLAARDPKNLAWKRDVSVAREKIGDLQLATGDKPGALASYRLELVETDALLATAPDDATRLRDDAIVHEKIGNALRALGRPEQAIAEYQTMVERLERAAAKKPGDVGAQSDLEVAWDDLGDGQREAGKRHDANASYREAHAILAPIAAKLDDQDFATLAIAELDAEIAWTIDGTTAEKAQLAEQAKALLDKVDLARRPDLAASVDEVKKLIPPR